MAALDPSNRVVEEDEGQHEEEDDPLLPTYWAAVIENRAKEVGVAVLDLAELRLELSQFVEPGRLYTSTLLHLVPRAPRAVVVVGSQHHEVGAVDVGLASLSMRQENRPMQTAMQPRTTITTMQTPQHTPLQHQVAGNSSLNAALHALPLAPMPRTAFDDTRGCLLVDEAAAPGCKPTKPALAGLVKSHYLAFGAAGALLQHLDGTAGAVVAPGTLRVEYGAATRQHMTLDHQTVTALELVRPIARPSACGGAAGAGALKGALAAAVVGAGGRGGRGGGGRGGGGGGRGRVAAATAARFSSLLAFLDHTATACGARLLRTNILQVTMKEIAPCTHASPCNHHATTHAITHATPHAQPMTDAPTIQLRLDALTELLESPHLALELASLMEQLPANMDKVLLGRAGARGDRVGGMREACCEPFTCIRLLWPVVPSM